MNTPIQPLADILIVEDSRTQAAQLKTLLERENYRVLVARDGVEALEQIQAQRPALVITDGNMPRLDGFELCRRIKADTKLQPLQVIIVTTLSEPGDVIRGLECGADNFIVKPYKPDDLLLRVSHILNAQLLQSQNSMQMGVSVFFANKRIFVTADRLQILNLLLSTYEAAVQQARDLQSAQVELAKVHKELVATSRLAGMAEVATNVLHNVGNVLNSVNVATSCMADSLRRSKAANLSKVVALLREHASDLGDFFTNHPKGKQLPDYLAQLATHLTGEQAATLKELAELQKNVEHINDIVTMQQSFAKVVGVTEAFLVADLVEDALRINASSLARHDIQILKECDEVTMLNLDRHKVLQVLVNLIRNAKHACDDSGRTDKRLTVRVASGDGRIRISVIDNGVGIPPENLDRIFSHGFTTRKGGHGFGLHGGALAAKEMDGALTVHSDGPDQGATFILELPCPMQEVAPE